MSLDQIALIPELRGHTNIDRDITTRGGNRRIAYMVNKVWSMPAMVGSTDLVTVLPRRYAELMAPLFNLEIHEPPIPIAAQDYHMIWHEKNTDDPGHKWLRDTLMKGIAAEPPAGDDFQPLRVIRESSTPMVPASSAPQSSVVYSLGAKFRTLKRWHICSMSRATLSAASR
eukprot:gene39223-53027_t